MCISLCICLAWSPEQQWLRRDLASPLPPGVSAVMWMTRPVESTQWSSLSSQPLSLFPHFLPVPRVPHQTGSPAHGVQPHNSLLSSSCRCYCLTGSSPSTTHRHSSRATLQNWTLLVLSPGPQHQSALQTAQVLACLTCWAKESQSIFCELIQLY